MRQFIIDGLGYAAFLVAGVVALAAYFDVLYFTQ
jgi:hypothetical protein